MSDTSAFVLSSKMRVQAFASPGRFSIIVSFSILVSIGSAFILCRFRSEKADEIEELDVSSIGS